MAGVYVHIPFCLGKCGYCAFVSRPESQGNIDAYLAALHNEINACPNASVDTVYVGGGTPTILSEIALKKLFDALGCRFSIAHNAEINIEANPETITAQKARALVSCGVNRVSLGLQTANDGILRAIGRRHSYADFVRAAEHLYEAGIKNISADFMLGLPDQGIADIMDALNKSAVAALGHISVYAFEPEAGTPLGNFCSDADLCADMYQTTCSVLHERGLERYEVSNFALPGQECRHNIGYWKRIDYYGLGAAAHSLIDGKRFANTNSIDAYIAGETIVLEQALSPDDVRAEAVMLGLRTRDGALKRYFSGKEDAISRFVGLGLLEEIENAYRLTDKGFYIMNAIVCELI